jgi:hypothetical protein
VKTFQESGLAHAEAVGWHGLVAPRGTPAEVVARLHAALVQALAVPEVQQRLAALGIEGTDAAPEALGVRMAADAERWGVVVRRAGLRPLPGCGAECQRWAGPDASGGPALRPTMHSPACRRWLSPSPCSRFPIAAPWRMIPPGMPCRGAWSGRATGWWIGSWCLTTAIAFVLW